MKIFVGHEIGKIISSSKFLGLPPSPITNLNICFRGNTRSHNKFFIFFLVDNEVFLTNSSFKPLIETTIFKLLALYADAKTVMKVKIKPAEKEIIIDVIEKYGLITKFPASIKS